MIGGVKQTSASISSATQQLAAGNTGLSQRTEEQAASLEETVLSIEELTATVRQNADNAKQATTLAHTTSEVALRGGKVVGRVVETMHEISGSSSKIAEIITAIFHDALLTSLSATTLRFPGRWCPDDLPAGSADRARDQRRDRT
jgi:methyl-accepting chemotaxis protein